MGDCHRRLSAINGANYINNGSHNLWIPVQCLIIIYVPQYFTLISFNILIHNSPVVSIHPEYPSLHIST